MRQVMAGVYEVMGCIRTHVMLMDITKWHGSIRGIPPGW